MHPETHKANQKVEASDVLRRAAEYIGEHGWHQGDYEGPDGGVCALGAIGRASGTLRASADRVDYIVGNEEVDVRPSEPKGS